MSHEPTAPDVVSREAREVARAQSSSLSLSFELVGCQLATTHTTEGRIIPQATFHAPCVLGKTAPDQDCRHCQYHTLTRYGAGRAPDGSYRYPHYGAVIPLTEAQAEQLAGFLDTLGTGQLTNPAWADQVERDRQAAAEQERRHAAARAMEAQQRGKVG